MIESLNVFYRNREDLARVAAEVLPHPADRIFLHAFCGVVDIGRIKELLADIRAVFPDSPVLGSTTAGEIRDGQSVEGTILVNVSRYESSRVRTALVHDSGDLRTTGRQLGSKLSEQRANAVIALGCSVKDGGLINAEPLLMGLQDCLPGVVIAGGQAADNGAGRKTYVFTESGYTDSGAAAAALSGERLRVNNAYNLSWVPIGKRFTITQAKGCQVYAIDNKPPVEIYRRYLGEEVVAGLPLSAADFPIMVERDGIDHAVHPVGVNEDGSLTYIQSFHNGEQLRFGFCHAGLLKQAAQRTYDRLTLQDAQVAFVYSCISRKWLLGKDIAVDLSSVRTLCPNAGFFCYGEYYYNESGKALFFGQTMTILTLAEEDEAGVVPVGKPFLPDEIDEESPQFRTLRALHNLVETSAREIECMNEELATLASKDSLTDLPNRRLFNEHLLRESERLARASGPLSLIMLDIDHFKAFNDTYGHVAGDDCLRAVAQVLQATIKRPCDLPARYGGEEFACVLPDTTHQGAMAIAGELQRNIAELAIPNAGSTIADIVTASIGVLTVTCSQLLQPEQIVQSCDELLYRSKNNGRNRVSGLDRSQEDIQSPCTEVE